jgi:hypothetical protein
MEKSILNKLLLSRRLFELARENLQSSNDLSLAVGVNLLQDSVEAFLIAVAEKVNAGIKNNTGFDKYFELINEKIKPKELPFQPRLISLNKLRVNSKHFGLAPAQSEIDGLFITVREFFEEVTSSILDKSFSTLSLIDLLRDNEEKELLKQAQEAFENEDFETTLISCRKAIFVRFESWYDISPFVNEEQQLNYLILAANKSPYFARNKDYIEKHVFDPTDFVVLDHNDIEMELMRSGLDSTSFWNVWRLTPRVYRKSRDGEWIVKQEFNKLENEGIRERAEYVLDATINLFIVSDQKIKATKSPDHRNYYIELRTDKIPLYEKADKDSKVLGHTPEGLMKVYVQSSVLGLKGDNIYWKVNHLEDDIYLTGFISNEALKK